MIEKYIQFGIENGYRIKHESHFDFYFTEEGLIKELVRNQKINIKEKNIIIPIDKEFEEKRHYLDVITRKDFIEAVARGIRKNKKSGTLYDLGLLGTRVFDNPDSGKLSKDICIKQALAIRDGTLDDFIKSILTNIFLENNYGICNTYI